MQRINKIEAAKRQLDTAIIMFFEKKDPLAVHTLACAAYDMLRNLAGNKTSQKLQTIKDNTVISANQKKDWQQELNNPQNFLKHADKDPNGILDFFPEITQYFLSDACNLYRHITTDITNPMIIYTGWFFTKNPNFLNPGEKQTTYKKIAEKLDTNNYSLFLNSILQLNKAKNIPNAF